MLKLLYLILATVWSFAAIIIGTSLKFVPMIIVGECLVLVFFLVLLVLEDISNFLISLVKKKR